MRAYERGAERWARARRASPLARRRIGALVADLPRGACVADLGCGPGWHLGPVLRRGQHALALDASAAMLARVPRRRRVLRVQADLAALPLGRGTLDAAFAIRSLVHVPLARWPEALARLHGALRPDAPLLLSIAALDAFRARPAEREAGELERRPGRGPLGERLFSAVAPERARELLADGGFDAVETQPSRDAFWLWLRARRAHTLPDHVRPGLALLVCGLNPSPVAAETGIPYGRPGNRFWPAAQAAGLVQVPRDPLRALADGIGFTDLCKRTTRRADELRRDEYAAGVARLERVVRRLQPGAVCFVGLDGWRRAVDRGARPGWIEGGFAGRPAYLMPSTSGLNAHARPADLTAHLRRAYTGARSAARTPQGA